MTEFGPQRDIPRIWVKVANAANNGRSAHMKTATEGAAICQAFLRLDIPISPRRPEPNSQAAAGTGTVEARPSASICVVSSKVIPSVLKASA